MISPPEAMESSPLAKAMTRSPVWVVPLPIVWYRHSLPSGTRTILRLLRNLAS